MEITENQMFFVFLFFVTVIVLFKCFESRESFSNLDNLDYMFYRPPSDCNLNGSCKQCGDNNQKEQEQVQKNVIFSRPNKCFSCEKEMLQKYARQYVNLAFPGKCISCEKEAAKNGKDPYHEGPTKCFSCMGNGK
tara:strand:- start:3379 stop:3783 length:405 start_codon:yes stop_codon:yes gene_type:complete